MFFCGGQVTATETVEKGPLHYAMGGTLFFLLGISKGGNGGNGNNGCNDNNDDDGEDNGNGGELWQQPLLPPLFVHCQNFWKTLSNFGRTLFAHNFGRHIPTYAQQNLFVFIAFSNKSY
jgi:hypothetical protein